MNLRALSLFLLTLLLALPTACTFPVSTPEPTATPVVIVIVPTLTSAPSTSTPLPINPATATSIPTATAILPPAFCSDSRVTALLDSFASALASANGEAMAALISPARGVDVRFIRDGRVVNYDREHFKYVFDSTYQVEWGLGAGSGLPVVGSFQQIALPSLRKTFTPSAQRACNQIKLGGATYNVTWPAEYASLNYYSVHFPGTDQYSGMDWQTWLVGFEMSNGQPFLRVLLRFEWEP
jgi:hypothetical protein